MIDECANDIDASLILHARFSMTRTREQVASIRSPVVQSPARDFARNVENLVSLHILPLVLIGWGHADLAGLASWVKTSLEWDTSGGENPKEGPEFDAAVQKAWDEIGADEQYQSDRVDSLKLQLAHLLTQAHGQMAARALVQAAVSSAWTAFECLGQDLWVASLNAHPIDLAHRAFAKLAQVEGEGMSRRSISVGLLARHGFDVRNVLGNLLSAKFDFTSVSGIRAAYTAAFGPNADLDAIFRESPAEDPFTPALRDLEELEATRHAIVHRAGRVDSEFRRRTGSEQKVGEFIHFDTASYSRLVNSAMDSGCALIEFVDRQFSREDQSEDG